MVKIWISSDLHLNHSNIIRFCNRPFSDVYEMNKALRDLHNHFVSPEDHWWCLGDVTLERGSKGSPQAKAFIEEMQRWHGHKTLFLGNHDHFPTEVYLDAGFKKIRSTWRFEDLIFSHIPIHPNSLSNVAANVHGHIHNSQPNYPPVIKVWPGQDGGPSVVRYQSYINVCVEMTNYRPLLLDEVRELVKKAKGEYEGVRVGDEVKTESQGREDPDQENGSDIQ